MIRLVFLSFLISSFGYGAACCGGAGPRSFIQLQRLQSFELGVSTTYKDIFGRHDSKGSLVGVAQNRTFLTQVGAGKRLTKDLDINAVVPVVSHSIQTGDTVARRTSVGDISAGLHYYLVESLFDRDPYPTVRLVAQLKAPTGSTEGFVNGKYQPETGTGYWEPSAGVIFEKQIRATTLLISGVYSYAFPVGDRKTGDTFEAAATLSYTASPRLSISGGIDFLLMKDHWRAGTGEIAGSGGNSLRVLLGTKFFFTRFFSAGLGLEAAVLGRNLAADQVASLTLKYGFY